MSPIGFAHFRFRVVAILLVSMGVIAVPYARTQGEAGIGFEELQSIVAMREKLGSIILPSVEFVDTPLRDALSFLQQESVERDGATVKQDGKGINIVLDDSSNTEALITLKLTNVPLSEALRYTTALAQLRMEIEPHAVLVKPLDAPGPYLITNVYRLPPGMIAPKGESKAGTDGVYSAKGILEYAGISFPPGSKALYDSKTLQLIVRNTKDEMELVEAYVAALIEKLPEGERAEFMKTEKPGVDVAGKLESLIIPSIEFVEMPFHDAIGFLHGRSVDLDPETDRARKGINILLERDQESEVDLEKRITLTLRNVSLGEAIRYTCSLADFEYEIDSDGIVIRPK